MPEGNSDSRPFDRQIHPGSGRRKAPPLPKGRALDTDALEEVRALLGSLPRRRDLLIEYLRAISGLQFPETKVESRGLERIYELGCFRCHGPMGTGGVANPGSLKGYVPGFFGEDYAETVSGPEELREWIRDGASARFRDNPLAAAVLERQALKMPAYGEHLDDDDLEAIAAAVEWLARGGWRSIDIP